ncbi:DUF3290 domain-containing protein [Flavisolibacter ginsenosidimutans]|uniref:DUF3290 domain-containing protein n=1 Tax=Flavisolibacter ginsenosidimutans TaxID=661481 RepID=A0A5B8UNS0_9BACT|nr:DUF3290 domain-containing protein [Flavisolibacter ginsenosidimutans]QEC58317.1 DUF3290 domain-containing protein [Flavisolibacter ginsenosidimutans]
MKLKSKSFWWFFPVLPIVIWFYNPFALYFLNDDAIHIPECANFGIRKGVSFRPLSELSVFFDAKLYGVNAWGYHLTNLLLHIGCTVLLYFVAKTCLTAFRISNEKTIAAFASFLFFIYAFHSEAVLWIIGRGGSLATIFAGLSLLCFFKRKEKPWAYPFSLFFFACGLLSYEAIWFFPLLVSLLLFLTATKQSWQKEIWYAAGFWLLFALFFFVRTKMEGSLIGTPYGIQSVSTPDLKRLAYNYTALFFRSFVPPAGTTVFVIASFAVLVILIFLFIHFLRKRMWSRFRIFTAACFLLSLLPYLLFGIDTHDSEGERFLYLPSFFLCLVLADWILSIPQHKVQLAVLALFVCFQFFFLYRSSDAYKQSSRIAKKTMQELQRSNETFDTIYFVDVPTQFRGGFVFRVGFDYILNWLAPNIKYRQTVEVSRREVDSRKESFMTTTTNWFKAKNELPKESRLDSLRPHDAIFAWTDSTFLFIRQ